MNPSTTPGVTPDSKPDTAHIVSTKARVIPLRAPGRWHDPLSLIQTEAPSESRRIVLWVVCVLCLVLFAWAAVGRLDVIAPAEGKLVPKTLIKVVQPAEQGIVRELLVEEGQFVRAGQVLARLDSTVARSDKNTALNELDSQRLQARRLEAELEDRPFVAGAGDNMERFSQVHNQSAASRRAFLDNLDQERSLLTKAQHERRSAAEILSKLEQTLPAYQRSADAYARLEKEGFIGGIASGEKQREMIEKLRDLQAQRSSVDALKATISAQEKRIVLIHSGRQSDLQKELAAIRERIAQLQPSLEKTVYREGLMELRAPQDGVVKDVSSTTVGAVVQPGAIFLTLIPQGDELFADVSIKNEDIGFVQEGQRVQIKLAAFPFQRYGMVSGTVIHISADASDFGTDGRAPVGASRETGASDSHVYKARVKLERQVLLSPHGKTLKLASGMQIVAEIHQGRRSVLEYLLSPIRKAAQEAARER